MNKLALRLGLLLLVLGLVVGCSSGNDNEGANTNNNQSEEVTDSSNSEKEQEEIVVITISKDEGAEVLTEKEIPIEEGAILMDVLKENFEIVEDGGLITSIDGVAPEEGEQKGWIYFVNDEMAMVGAAEYELSVGDKVTFDLQAWE